MGALAADREAATVAEAPVATEVHQPLDIDCDLAPQVAFDHVVAVDDFTDLQDLLVGQLRHPALDRDVDLFHDFLGFLPADAVNVLQGDNHPLVGRYVHTCARSHVYCSSARQAGTAALITTPKLRMGKHKRKHDARPWSRGSASLLNSLRLGAAYLRIPNGNVNLC